jgi:solute carrier family 25 phosphate transporter 23/24/25/41
MLTGCSLEFRTFVERTEKELLSLFASIDRDHNGKVDKGDLKEAFRKAGLTVSNAKLNQFFAEMDDNHDVRSLVTTTPLSHC